MAKKKVTKASKRRLILFGTLSCLMVGYFLFSAFHYTYSITKLENQKTVLEEQLVTLKEEEQTLKTEIQKLQDPEYIARYARENYLYSKDGEYIIKIEKEEPEEKKEEEVETYYPIFFLGIGIVFFFIILYILRKS